MMISCTPHGPPVFDGGPCWLDGQGLQFEAEPDIVAPRLKASFDVCSATPIVAGANYRNLSNLPHVEKVAVNADQ
jgi:hypothetical protein